MQKIHGADYWRRLVSYGKYPLIFSFELAMGLGGANKATGFKTKLKNYCRFAGGSHISEGEAQSFASEMSALLKKNPKKVLEWKNKS